MKIFKFIICLLFALVFIHSGLNKFFNYMPMPEPTAEQMKTFSAFMQIKWLMPLVGFIEIVGGILFAIPKWRALGAIVILPVMVGILLHHIVLEPAGLSLTIVFFLINIWILIDNRKKYEALISN